MFVDKMMYRQFRCVIPISCLYFMVGLGRGWIAPILSEAKDPNSTLPLTSEQSSWIASISYLTRGLSPLFLAFLVDKVGRNAILVFNALVLFGMWIAVYWSRDVFVHYIIRLLFGVSDGLQDAVSSIYVCENCSPQYRGTFYTVAMLFLFSGHFFVFVFATYCSYGGVAIAYAVLGFVTLLTTFLLVEPPHYFLLKGDVKKAEKNFARLRNVGNADSAKEFEAIKKNIEEEKSKPFSLAMYRSKEVVASMRHVLIMMAACAGCGWAPMIAFVTKLLANSDGLSGNQLCMLYGVIQFVAVGATSLIMDRFGRRTLFMLSAAVESIILAALGALYCLRYRYEITGFQFILCALFTLYASTCAGFSFPLMGLIRGELFPQSVKMMGSGLSQCFISLVSFTIARLFLPITEEFGIEYNFFIYSCSALLVVLYTYFCLPETRGKTLVDIQNELKGIEENKFESSHL